MILTAMLMLRHLGRDTAAGHVEEAVAALLEEGETLTPDMGGSATSRDVAEAVAARLDPAS
jgi:isocitrate dehydrogenase (NAD+)